MKREIPLECFFFETEQGNQPVREFLLDRKREDRKEVGADISRVQDEFPLGMPLVEKVSKDLWAIRSHLPDGICRTFFTVDSGTIILIHSFIKKSQKIPVAELKTATGRLKEYRRINK